MTLSELIFRVTRKSGLNDDVPDDHQNLLLWANDGVVETLIATHCVIETGQLTLTIGSNLYTLDPSVLVLKAAQLQSSNQIYDVEIVHLDRLRSAQRVQSTSPTRMLAMEGDRLYVYPDPTTADLLTWDFVPRPSQRLVNPGDDPSTPSYGRIPTEFHRAIEYYMVWQAAEYDDRGGGFWRGHAFAPGSAYKDYFDEECQKIRNRIKRHARTPLRPMIGYPARLAIPTRNDQDIVRGSYN